jgi:hypothetical protein
MLVLATTNSGLYKLVLVLHILCAIVGFVAVYLNGVYGAEMKKRRGADSLAIYEANWRVTNIGQYVILGVLIFGLALVGLSDSAWKFSQTWVWLAVTLFVIGLGVSHGILLPAMKRMGVLMREMVAAGPPPAGAPAGPPPQAVEMEALGKRLGVAGGFLNVLIVVILIIMVWKPGV